LPEHTNRIFFKPAFPTPPTPAAGRRREGGNVRDGMELRFFRRGQRYKQRVDFATDSD